MKRSCGMRRAGLLLGGIAGMCLMFMAALFAYLSLIGFPQWLTELILPRVTPRGYYMEARSIRLTQGTRVAFRKARIFRIGVVGPPAAEAAEVVVRFRPLSFLRRRWSVPEMAVYGASIRPILAFSQEEERVEPEREPNIRMRLFVHDSDVQGLLIERASTFIRGEGFTLVFQDSDVTVGGPSNKGTATGSVRIDLIAQTAMGNARVTANPLDLTDFLRSWRMDGAADFFENFEFGEGLPTVDARFDALTRRDWAFNMDGTFSLQSCTFRGEQVLKADGGIIGRFSDSESVLDIDDFLMVRREGLIQGEAEIDFKRSIAHVDMTSTAHPQALFRMMGIDTHGVFDAVFFDGPARIWARGFADYGAIEKTDLVGSVEAWDAAVMMIVSDRLRMDLTMRGPAITATNIQALVYGGSLNGSARLIIPYDSHTNTSYFVDLNLRKADFQQVAEALLRGTGRGDFDGTFSGSVTLEGLAGEGRSNTARGTGRISVEDGRVFMLPVFGGFSEQMARIVPGLDMVLRQSHARIGFDIEKGRAISEDINILGDILSITAQGYYGFDRSLDFAVQVRLTKDKTLLDMIIRTATSLVSKLFEFRLKGTLDQPKWDAFGILQTRPR